MILEIVNVYYAASYNITYLRLSIVLGSVCGLGLFVKITIGMIYSYYS